MRILHLSSEFPPQKVFGLGRFVRDLAEEQTRQKHEVVVITNNFGGKLSDTTVNGVRILRVDHPNPPKPNHMTGCVMIFNILMLRKALELGFSVLRRFDVVCSHDWLSAPTSQALSQALGIPHISTFHDTTIGKRLGKLDGPVDELIVELERWTASTASHVIANSAATKQELVDEYAIPSERMTVVPCAIAPGTFATMDDPVRWSTFRSALAAENERIVLYVGRLDSEKGVDVLLKAFAAAKLPSTRLLIAGQSSGEWGASLITLARSLALDPDDVFLGYVESPVLQHLYRSADVLVCPSLYEPFGMVAIEGMLQGTPAIVSNTGGLGELVEDGVTGMKVKPGDVESLRKCLVQMMSDETARKSMGAAARMSVLRHHTWPMACRETTQIYKGCRSARPKRRQMSPAGVFIAPGLTDAQGYGVERQGQALFGVACRENPELKTLTDGDDLLPLKGFTSQEIRLIQAFNMAAKAVARHVATPPRDVISFHWVGALAASVFQHVPEIARRVYYSPPVHRIDKVEGELNLDVEMPVWAMLQGSENFFPDEITQWISTQFEVRGIVRALPSLEGRTSDLADPMALRSVLADDRELLAVTALRLDPPFSINALVMMGHAAAAAGLRIRWIVCGDGEMAHRLREAVECEKLPISLLGYVPSGVLERILQVADLAFIARGTPAPTSFVQEAINRELPIIVPRSYAFGATARPVSIWEADCSSREQLLTLFKELSEQDRFGRYRSAAMPAPGLLRSTATTAVVSKTQALAPIGPTGEKDAASKTLVVKPKQPGFVLFNDWGIGDELMLSAVAREITREHPELRIWIRSRYGFQFPAFVAQGQPPHEAHIIETIYQNTVLCGPQYHAPFPGHLVQQMLDKFGLDTGIAVKAKDVRPEVLLSSHSLTQRDQRVLVIHAKPNPSLPSKDWGLERWQTLCQILNAAGFRLRQVGARNEPQLPYAEDLRGMPVSELPAVIASASAVVCVTGLQMHIAAATGTPAVVIYGGREHPAIDGYPGHVHLCCDPLPCRGRWGCHLAPYHQCPHGMRCMSGITPEFVAYEANLLVARFARGAA